MTERSLANLKKEAEETWAQFDEVFSSLPETQWSKKFGSDWTFADQPYHLAYFDRAIVAEPISNGPDIPKDKRWLLTTSKQVDDWNTFEFNKRPAGQTGPQALEEWRMSHDLVRKSVDGLTDADLDRRAWQPLTLGWATVGDALNGCTVHNISEYIELWLRTGRKGPQPSPTAIGKRIDFMIPLMASFVNKEAAKGVDFTMAWNFTGPHGSEWTLTVHDGSAEASEGRRGKADLEMTMEPMTFEIMLKKLQNPMIMLLTRKIKVKGFGKMGLFGKLFSEPKPADLLATDEAIAESSGQVTPS